VAPDRSREALATLLDLLWRSGLAIGADDAARVAAVFGHAQGWPRERKLRALKALLGRTEGDRATIDRLGAAGVLFPVPPAPLDGRVGEAVRRLVRRGPRKPPPEAGDGEAPPPLPPPDSRWLGRVVLAAVPVVLGLALATIAGLLANRRPVALAAATAASVRAGGEIVLNGSASSDPDGDDLAYRWTLVGVGPPGFALDSAERVTRMKAPRLPPGQDARLTFELTVADPSGAADRARVVVPVVANRAPVARARAEPTPVSVGHPFRLDGTGSIDPDGAGAPLSYEWRVVAGSPGLQLSDPRSARVEVTAPGLKEGEEARVLRFELTVTDADEDADAATVEVTVVRNRPPRADAGPARRVAPGGSVRLDGSGSFDPDGDPLTYTWRAGGGGVLESLPADPARPVFKAGDKEGTFTIALRVEDDEKAHGEATTTVTVARLRPPVARAVAPAVVTEGDRVELDGSATTGPDGPPLTFAWRSLDPRARVELRDAAARVAAFEAPAPAPDGRSPLSFELTVEDASGGRSADVVDVAVNRLPRVDAGRDAVVVAGTVATLAGSGSDPDGDPLSFRWTGDPAVAGLDAARAAELRFVAPPVAPGERPRAVDLSLTADDGRGGRAADAARITVVPEVLPVEAAPPRWPLLALLGVALLGGGWVAWTHRALRTLRTLARSPGPRTYRPADLAGTPEPVEPALAREFAFRLSAATEPEPSPWLDVARTIDATARRAGLFSPRYRDYRVHKPIVLIEDRGPSMTRWAEHGAQLARALARQGGTVHHVYMPGLPREGPGDGAAAAVVALDAAFERTLLLERYLATFDRPVALVFSDGSGLAESAASGGERSWLDAFDRLTWIHPRPPALWTPRVRRLARRIAVVPLSDEGLSRLNPGWRLRSLPARWRPPAAPRDNPRRRVLAWKYALGPQAFAWLAAGAVLDRAGLLTAQLWWALLRQGIVSAPIERVECVFELPGVTVYPDGSIALPDDVRDELVAELGRTDGDGADRDAATVDLLSRVVDWARGIVERDLDRLPEESLAGVSARALLARVLSVDPTGTRPAEAKGAVEDLERDGHGAWLEPHREELARARITVTTSSARRPLWRRTGFAAAVSLAAAALLVSTWLGLRARPPEPGFEVFADGPIVLAPGDALLLSPRAEVGDREVWAEVGGRRAPLRSVSGSSPQPIYALRPGEPPLDGQPAPARVEVRLGVGERSAGERVSIELAATPASPLGDTWNDGALDVSVPPGHELVVGVERARQPDERGGATAAEVRVQDGRGGGDLWRFTSDGRGEDSRAGWWSVSNPTATARALRLQARLGESPKFIRARVEYRGPFFALHSLGHRGEQGHVLVVSLAVVPAAGRRARPVALVARGLADGRVLLTWPAAPGEGGGDETAVQWLVRRDGDDVGAAAEGRWLDAPAGPGPWTYEVVGVGSKGAGFRSPAVVAPAFVPAVTLRAVVEATGRVVLRFTPSPGASERVTEWLVVRDHREVARVRGPAAADGPPPGTGPWRYTVLGLADGRKTDAIATAEVRASRPPVALALDGRRSRDAGAGSDRARVELRWGPRSGEDVEGVAGLEWIVWRDGREVARTRSPAWEGDLPAPGAVYSVSATGPDGRFHASPPIRVAGGAGDPRPGTPVDTGGSPPLLFPVRATWTASREVVLELFEVPEEGGGGRGPTAWLVERARLLARLLTDRPVYWELQRDGRVIAWSAGNRFEDLPPGGGPWSYRVHGLGTAGTVYRSFEEVVPPMARDLIEPTYWGAFRWGEARWTSRGRRTATGGR